MPRPVTLFTGQWADLPLEDRIGYPGPLSIEWEDSGMDRDWRTPDALAFVRRTDFSPSEIAFDVAMQKAGSKSCRPRRLLLVGQTSRSPGRAQG